VPDSDPARARLGVVSASLGRVGKWFLRRRSGGRKLPVKKLEMRGHLKRIIERGQAPGSAVKIKAASQEQLAQIGGR